MEKLYELEGTVNNSYTGQIMYTVCLDHVYEKLALVFAYEKRLPETLSAELTDSFITLYEKATALPPIEEIDAAEAIMQQKTEIHITASMNHTFIGGLHRQLDKRYLFFSPWYASRGCIPQTDIHGVLQITLIFFRVLYDKTPYKLSVWGKRRMD